MSEALCLVATKRDQFGSSQSRRNFREHSRVPAVVYGGGENGTSVWLDHFMVEQAMKRRAFHSAVFSLKIDGVEEQVVLKALQKHPVRAHVIHVDFFRVSANELLTMKVPLRLLGEDMAPGVKQDGGVIAHLLTEVEVKCLPKDLPALLEVDVSELTLGSTIHLSMVSLPANVEYAFSIEGDHDLPVATVQVVAQEPPEPTQADELVGDEASNGDTNNADA